MALQPGMVKKKGMPHSDEIRDITVREYDALKKVTHFIPKRAMISIDDSGELVFFRRLQVHHRKKELENNSREKIPLSIETLTKARYALETFWNK
jgi:hypothetical protein